MKTEDYGPETKKFMAWYEDQRANHGLIDVKFITANLDGATVELFFAEVNQALAAKDMADPNLDSKLDV